MENNNLLVEEGEEVGQNFFEGFVEVVEQVELVVLTELAGMVEVVEVVELELTILQQEDQVQYDVVEVASVVVEFLAKKEEEGVEQEQSVVVDDEEQQQQQEKQLENVVESLEAIKIEKFLAGQVGLELQLLVVLKLHQEMEFDKQDRSSYRLFAFLEYNFDETIFHNNLDLLRIHLHVNLLLLNKQHNLDQSS